jgi:hypothetical protein
MTAAQRTASRRDLPLPAISPQSDVTAPVARVWERQLAVRSVHYRTRPPFARTGGLGAGLRAARAAVCAWLTAMAPSARPHAGSLRVLFCPAALAAQEPANHWQKGQNCRNVRGLNRRLQAARR